MGVGSFKEKFSCTLCHIHCNVLWWWVEKHQILKFVTSRTLQQVTSNFSDNSIQFDSHSASFEVRRWVCLCVLSAIIAVPLAITFLLGWVWNARCKMFHHRMDISNIMHATIWKCKYFHSLGNDSIYTVDPWTTWVWTAWVHLYVNFFSRNTSYSSTSWLVESARGEGATDTEGQL